MANLRFADDIDGLAGQEQELVKLVNHLEEASTAYGLEWNILQRKAENREEWRKLVVKSTVVPQRSARLRDRYNKVSPPTFV